MSNVTSKRAGLKILRFTLGLTQKQMADMLGVKRVTLSAYENGTREGNLEFWFNLQRVFDLSNDDLVEAMKRGNE